VYICLLSDAGGSLLISEGVVRASKAD